MPQPTAAGVFGIARTTATSLCLPRVAAASCCSTKLVGTEAATDRSNVLAPISGAISCKTSATVWGFTVSRTMSASFTPSRLSVVTATFSSFASAAALSECLTVAVTRSETKSPCFRYARSRMPPSLPAPSTANFLSESFGDMVSPLPTNERFLDFARNDKWLYRRSVSAVSSRIDGWKPWLLEVRIALSRRRTRRARARGNRKLPSNVHSSGYRSGRRSIGVDSLRIRRQCLQTSSLRYRNSVRRNLIPRARSRTWLRSSYAIFCTRDMKQKRKPHYAAGAANARLEAAKCPQRKFSLLRDTYSSL